MTLKKEERQREHNFRCLLIGLTLGSNLPLFLRMQLTQFSQRPSGQALSKSTKEKETSGVQGSLDVALDEEGPAAENLCMRQHPHPGSCTDFATLSHEAPQQGCALKSGSVKGKQLPQAACQGGKNLRKGSLGDRDLQYLLMGYQSQPVWGELGTAALLSQREERRRCWLQGGDHLLPEPGPQLAPAPWSAWAEQPLRELLSHFWQDPFSCVAAKEPLARQAH